jgi:ribosomal-protein-serine acetyltransferase
MLRFPIDEHAEMRLYVEADAPKLFSVVDANREHLQEWLPWLDRNTEEAHSRQFTTPPLKKSGHPQKVNKKSRHP